MTKNFPKNLWKNLQNPAVQTVDPDIANPMFQDLLWQDYSEHLQKEHQILTIPNQVIPPL